MSREIKISVIIPVYRVERFIVRCAESLLGQTMKDAEFIFVDDATPDGSIGLLQECIARHPERDGAVKVLKHDVNRGLPAARNTGMSVAEGQYIFHCDSDDWLDADALQRMYDAASGEKADIVWCDWYLTFRHNERYMKQPGYGTPVDALKGMLSGAMKFNVWNKLVSRSLYTGNGISFPDGYGMGEDMTMIQLFACAQKVSYLPKALYHYVRFNANGFTQIGNRMDEQKLEDLRYNTLHTVQFIQLKMGDQLKQELAFFQLEAKFPFLLSDDRESYKRWTNWFPEANSYIMQNRNISFRSRFLQYMASQGQFWYVWLYYRLFIKFIYGVLYR